MYKYKQIVYRTIDLIIFKIHITLTLLLIYKYYSTLIFDITYLLDLNP